MFIISFSLTSFSIAISWNFQLFTTKIFSSEIVSSKNFPSILLKMFTLRQRQFNFISVLFINIYYYMYVYIAKKLHNNISLHAIFACNLLLLIHLICPANDIYTHTHTHTAKPSGQAYCWPINAQQTFVHMTRQEYLFNWWQKDT